MKKFAFGASKFFLGSVFGCVFVLLLFFTQCTYAKKQTFLLSNIALLLFGIPLFVLFLSLDRLQQVKLSWHRPTVSSDVLIYGLCLLLFSAQLYISYNIYFETGWDAGLLTENARNLMHKHSVDIRYFSNYPNNLLYFFFELFVFKLNKYFSIFSDTQQVLCVITVNCALNTLSCLLVYKTAARLTRKLYAFFGFFLAVLSFGLSPWNVICYTDALGLIFPILTLYVFIRPAKYKWLSYVLSAIIGTLGYFIKPQCFILLIAVFLIEGIYALSEKHLLKPLLLSLLTVAITFFAVKAGTDFLCSHYHIQLDNEQSFGIAHFWMMGLNPEKKVSIPPKTFAIPVLLSPLPSARRQISPSANSVYRKWAFSARSNSSRKKCSRSIMTAHSHGEKRDISFKPFLIRPIQNPLPSSAASTTPTAAATCISQPSSNSFGS